MKRNCYLLIVFVVSLFVFSCSEDEAISRPEEVVIETVSGKKEVVQNGTLVFKVKAKSERELKYSWKIGGKEVGTESVYTFVAETLGEKQITVEVSNEGGVTFGTFDFSVYGKYRDGTFILNEGNMTTEYGSLIFISPQGDIVDSVYTKENNGSFLGNVCQDLFISNKKMYILSQNGGADGMLVVVNSETLRKENSFRKIDMVTKDGQRLNWPTHLVVKGDYAYIRDQKGIYRLNLATKELEYIKGSQGVWQSRMVLIGDKLFAYKRHELIVIEELNIVKTISGFSGEINGIIRTEDDNILVSCTSNPSEIVKINSASYSVMKTNKIEGARIETAQRSTPPMSLKGDTVYFSNNEEIYRHLFSSNTTKRMTDVKEHIEDANMVYGNLGVHPITGDVYFSSIKGFGWSYLTNDITIFSFKDDKIKLENDYKNYTNFPAGIFFTYSFK